MLSVVMMTAGVVGYYGREAMLHEAGKQLSNATSAGVTGVDTAQPLSAAIPDQAQNIVELQPLIADFTKQYPKINWGITIERISGPQLEASVQPKALFDSRALYRVVIGATALDQQQDKKALQSVKVGKKSIAVRTCVERLFVQDDRECLQALTEQLDQDRMSKLMKRAGMKQASVNVTDKTVRSSARDTAEFFRALDNDLLPAKQKKQLNDWLMQQPEAQRLTIACPGCTAIGATDFGLGRLEAFGIVHYSKGSYLYIIHGSGGTKDMTVQLSGKVQQRIVEVTTGTNKP